MNRFAWFWTGLLSCGWAGMVAAQEPPLATPPFPVPAKFNVPVPRSVPSKPMASDAKAPTAVDLEVRLVEIRSDLKLPLPERALKAGASANGAVLAKEDIARVIEVCQADRRTNILCTPRMRLNLGQAGQIRSGGEIVLDVPQSGRKPDDASKPASQNRFFGTALDATVTEPKPGLLKISLMVEHSVLTRDQVDGMPGIESRRVQTVAELASGQTMLLRGLLSNRTTATVTRVPVLGDLPVVGDSLFSRKRTETEQTELMLLVTPTAIIADGN